MYFFVQQRLAWLSGQRRPHCTRKGAGEGGAMASGSVDAGTEAPVCREHDGGPEVSSVVGERGGDFP